MVKSRLATKKAGSRQKRSFHLYLRTALFSCAQCGHFFFVEDGLMAAVVAGVTEGVPPVVVAVSASGAFRARYALILR